MADGVLGIAGGGSTALSQDVIDKLKEAERGATVAPIEKKVETWDKESLKMMEIKALNLALVTSLNAFDVQNTTNAFEKKSAVTTGTAVSYDTSNSAELINGTVNIAITQLAQKDVYQTSTFSSTSTDIALNIPKYESSKVSRDTANDLVGAGTFTITPKDGTEISITTDATTTWDDLVTLIDDADSDNNLDVSITDNRFLIKHTDGTTELTIKDGTGEDDGSVVSDLGMHSVEYIKIQVSGAPVYQSISTSTSTSTDKVGAGEFTITPNGAGALTITTTDDTTWDELKDMINADSNLVATYENNRLSISHTDKKTTLAIADTSGNVSADLGITRGRMFSTEGKTYTQIATDINTNSKLNSSVEEVGEGTYRLVIKSAESGTANSLTITETGIDLKVDTQMKSVYSSSTGTQIVNGDDDGDEITINGVSFSTVDKSYKLLAADINDHADFNASVIDGQIVITASDESNLVITQTGVDLGFSSAVVQAQNLKATIDGIAYDVSSNSITTQGSLTISAQEIGNSSITISQDTSGVLIGAKDIAEKYNEFITLIDAELSSTESSIYDKSSLRMMKTSMKDVLFGSYGTNSDLNIFSSGFELDKSGKLSINETVFNAAVGSNLENLKTLFVGTSATGGLGTLLKALTDGFDDYEGLLDSYDKNMTTRKTTLDKDLAKEIESLDSKYKLMTEEFGAYGSIIATMEAQFSSLKLMIDQSVASN